jgi:predicted nucleotidyltransferase
MSNHNNIVRIKAIAGLMDQLHEDVVFVGGATVSLYADLKATESRPTDDVDIIIELASYHKYVVLDERLRDACFVNDTASGVICRYQIQGITVDIMPTHPEAIGFSNKWYPDGFKESITVNIDGKSIKIFSLPYFIASKLEAFNNRGKGDYRFSSDFEDIVYVLENNSQVQNLIMGASPEVRQYLQIAFKTMLYDSAFEEGLTAHLEPHTAQQQVLRIETMLKVIVEG